MNWKFTADRPVYQQIMATLRGAVVTGELPPGGKVPSVRELATSAQVNPNTMQRALTELEREGLLIGGGTTGRTVTRDEGTIAGLRQQLLRELARDCVEKFKVFGISPREAGAMLAALEDKKEE